MRNERSVGSPSRQKTRNPFDPLTLTLHLPFHRDLITGRRTFYISYDAVKDQVRPLGCNSMADFDALVENSKTQKRSGCAKIYKI